MSKKLILIGGGGHCKSVLDSLFQNNDYAEIGIIDKVENIGKYVLDIPIIGSDNDLYELFQRGYTYAFVTVGSIGDPTNRVRLFAELERIGFEIPNIIDKSSVVSKYAVLSKGIYVGKSVVINIEAFIDKGAIINTSAVVEHDCIIGKFSHIAPGSVLCGEVNIGEYTHVGAKSVVKQQVKIKNNVLIGAGSVVLHDIPENVVAFGNPCKVVKKR